MRRLLFECYDRTFEGMTDSEWRVFCAICKHANDDTGGDCFPSTSLLAKESRLHKNTVPPQIKSLEEKKWIRTEQESGKRRYFFVDVGRIFSCPRIGGNYSVPLQEPVPLNNSVPLQEPVADGYRKIEGTGTESCTRREQLKEQLKEQEENSIVNDVYGKQGLPSTTITDTVNDVYGKGKQRLPITDKEQITEQINLSVGDSSFSLEPNEAPAENTTSNTAETATDKGRPPADAKSNKPPKRKAITHLFELEAIPDEWRELCEQIRPDLDPRRVFVEFRFYWTQGKGQGTRRSDKGWTSTWMNWVKRQKEDRTSIYQAHTEIPFSQRDYTKGINDDNSI